VNNPLLLPSGRKIIFGVNEKDKKGIWSYDLSTRNINIPIFSSPSLTQVVKDTDKILFSVGSFESSPNSEQLLVKTAENTHYLLDADSLNNNPSPFRGDVNVLKETWAKQRQAQTTQAIEKIGKDAENIAKNLTDIKVSPDKTRFFGKAKDGTFHIYDFKPAVNSGVKFNTSPLPKANSYLWFPDNKHIVLIDTEKLTVMEIDGANYTSIFTGKFDEKFVAPWPDGSSLVILTSFNSTVNPVPNLYAIELN
jgi:WD40 repeat protein